MSWWCHLSSQIRTSWTGQKKWKTSELSLLAFHVPFLCLRMTNSWFSSSVFSSVKRPETCNLVHYQRQDGRKMWARQIVQVQQFWNALKWIAGMILLKPTAPKQFGFKKQISVTPSKGTWLHDYPVLLQLPFFSFQF